MRLPPSLVHLPLRIISYPATRALLVCSLIWLFGFSYGRLFLWRDPHSAYFRSESVYDLDYSAVRQNQSREFIAQVTRDAAENLDNGAGEGRMSKAGDTPALCAMFVTVRRESETARLYLADAVGSMLAGLDPRERTALNLSLLFADTDPTRHPDWDAPWVKALVDDASGYKGLTDLQSAGLRKAEEERDLQLKGVFDYVYVLERCLEETTAPFIAVLEDDIVFSADWMARTLRGLQYIVRDRQPSEAENGTDWLYLRLFYTETHLGWVADEDWWYGHLPLTLGLSAACTATALLVLRSLGCGSRLRLDLATIAVVSVLVAPSFTVLAFMAGKHNLPLRGSLHSRGPLAASTSSAGVVPMDKHGCCTQALVFNRLALPGLIQALRQKERGQTDMMIEEYADAIGTKRFAMGDQVAQHVGLVSSRGMSAENTRSVWAFWFEAYKPHEVERRHQKALEEVDWSMFAKLAGAGI